MNNDLLKRFGVIKRNETKKMIPKKVLLKKEPPKPKEHKYTLLFKNNNIIIWSRGTNSYKQALKDAEGMVVDNPNFICEIKWQTSTGEKIFVVDHQTAVEQRKQRSSFKKSQTKSTFISQ